MMQRMFGHRTVPKIAKYAVVIYIYTHESKFDCNSTYAQNKARGIAKQMTLKLIERLEKQKKYDNFLDKRDENYKYSDFLKHVLTNGRSYKYFNVWMLQLNQAVHRIIHDLAQDYDPADTDAKHPMFYREIFEELTA